jgi:hypothetical protein
MRGLLITLMFGLSLMASAQQPDSSTLERDSADVSQPAVPGEQSPKLDENETGAESIGIKMLREEVPPFLQKILREEKYRGWENGGVYRNDQGTMFRVEVMDGMKIQTYYFDNNGSLIRAE